MACAKQKTKPCLSCPWVKDGDRSVYFDPKALKKTVVHHMQNGNLHPCHANNEDMCAGYLAYAEKYLEFGVDTLQMGRISRRLNLLDVEKINTEINVFDSIPDMLTDHKYRMQLDEILRGNRKSKKTKPTATK